MASYGALYLLRVLDGDGRSCSPASPPTSIPPDSPRPAEPCVAATSGSGGPQHPQNQRNLSMTGTIYAVSAIASSLPSTP